MLDIIINLSNPFTGAGVVLFLPGDTGKLQAYARVAGMVEKYAEIEQIHPANVQLSITWPAVELAA